MKARHEDGKQKWQQNEGRDQNIYIKRYFYTKEIRQNKTNKKFTITKMTKNKLASILMRKNLQLLKRSITNKLLIYLKLIHTFQCFFGICTAPSLGSGSNT